MKTWKLVSGILSIVLFAVVMFQSCAAGIVNSVEQNGDVSGSAGVILSILMLAGGIVSIATRKAKGKGGNIALIVLFGIAGVVGIVNVGVFKDLMIWSVWCFINAGVAVIAIIMGNKNKFNIEE